MNLLPASSYELEEVTAQFLQKVFTAFDFEALVPACLAVQK